MRIPTPWDVWLEGHPPGSNVREDYQLQANCYRQGYATALASEPVQGLVTVARVVSALADNLEANLNLSFLDMYDAEWKRGIVIAYAKDISLNLKDALAAYEEAQQKEEAHGS